MFKRKNLKTSVPLKTRLQAVRQRMLVHGGLLGLSLIAGLYFLQSSQIALLERQAFALKSDLFAIRHQEAFKAARQRILLVEISESTFRDSRIKWKDHILPRHYHARIIDALARLKAQAIVFDMAFVTPKPDDGELVRAAQKFRRLVWATNWESQKNGPDGKMVFPLPALRKIGYCGHPRMPNSLDSFEDEAHPSTDRVEAFVSTDEGDVPALCVQAARLAGNTSKLEKGDSYVQAGAYHVPLDEKSEFKIIFSAPPRQGFEAVPYEELLKGVQNDPLFGSEAVYENRIVFIGDTTELTKDFGFTPVGRMSGMEIHAHALANVLQGNIVRDAPASFNLGMIVAAVLLFWIAVLLVPLRFYAPCIVFLSLGVVVFNFWFLLEKSLDLALMAPLGAGLLMSLGILAERGWTTEGESRRLNDLMEHYLSPQVAQSGAPRGEVTLVFTDIEGSSSLSERFGANFEKARDAHFELLREAALRWNGFEVETAGDSLFIVFADPRDAVRFAITGQLALKKHSWPSFLREAQHEQEGWAGFDLPVRIGLHTGKPFIGRDRNRLTYRGPHTHRAARVMGLGHGGQILLSQATRDKVGDTLKDDPEFASVHYLERGAYRLKGVGEVQLWEACHPDLFDPPPRPLRDDLIETPVAKS